MDEHSDFKTALSSAGPLKPVVAQVKLLMPAAIKEGTSRPSTKQAGTTKPAIALTEADNSMVVTTPIAFLANIPQGSEAGIIEDLKLRTYVMSSVLPQEVQPPVQWDPCNNKFFVTQQSAAQAMAGAPVASDLGSEDDDDVPMSKQHILDSDSNDNAAEHCHKEWHNANARQLLAIDAEKSKLVLKHLNDTVPGHLLDSWETMLVCRHFEH
ncbi:hypothetical protein J132_01058 [Termitomyces sp. J132]|nr:hypothetical protein J132_01058 [Termitomyces sp. J132]